MILFENIKGALRPIKSQPFKLEKEIQALVESNMESMFELEFVRSEFPLMNFRIDTLGFDQQTNSFVIIEYKRGASYSVIDQGYTYLSLLLNNKSDFILEYQERTGRMLKREQVDWSQSRVLFISTQFNSYQKQSIEFKGLPFELWEMRRYSNNTISLHQHEPSSQEDLSSLTKLDHRADQVRKQIKVYSLEEHLGKGSQAIKELAIEIKDRILELDQVTLNPVKQYLGFKHNKRLICDFEVQKAKLRLRINLKQGQLDDPRGLFRDVSNIGTFGVGDYEAVIVPDTDVDYLMSLIKVSYRHHLSD